MTGMSDSLPKLPKWPFLLSDLLLLGCAYGVIRYSQAPLDFGRLALVVMAVALGAACAIYPFVHEFRLACKLAEAGSLATATAQIGNLERLMSQIGAATARWQVVQEAADQTAANATQIAGIISTEVKAFHEFMHKANDTERSTLRLEVEKMRRQEGDWLHASVHILDHVYALNQSAIRSGQPQLIENLGAFQTACREIVRRLGLVAFGAKPAEPFDKLKHRLPEGDAEQATGLPVTENVACGYTYQGRLLRPAVVKVQAGDAAPASAPESEIPAGTGGEAARQT